MPAHPPRGAARAAADAVLLAVNVVAVFFVTRYLFDMNERAVFFGWDPQSMLALITVNHRFSDILFGIGSDPVIGLGNIAAAINPLWFPGYRLTTAASGLISDGPLTYAICATELFAAVAFCGRILGVPAGPSAVAAWLLTFLTWPLLGWPPIANIWEIIPHHAEILAVSIVAVTIATWRVCGPLWRVCLAPLAIFLCLSYVLFATPTSLILVTPVIGVFAALQISSAPGRQARLALVLCWGGLALVALALGYVQYLVGLVAYTAAGQFPDVSKRLFTLYNGEVSLFLWTAIPDLSWVSIMTPHRVLLGGGVLGSLLALLLGPPRLRRLALGLLVAEASFFAVGLANYYLNFWFGPSIWYFELHLLPYFALFAVYLAASPAMAASGLAGRWLPDRARQAVATFANAAVAVAAPIAFAAIALERGPEVHAASLKDWSLMLAAPYPEPETAMTRILKEEIALAPGTGFRGRVAVMTGAMFPEQREWQRYSFVHFFALLDTGNLHDGPSLWQDSIPTLHEYNTLITPFSFAFLRTFFTRPGDVVTRNIIGMRNVDPRMLVTLGVRFVITEQTLEGAKLRLTLPIRMPPAARRRLSAEHLDRESFDLHLYELDGANLGQFSPTEWRVAGNANDTLTLLSAPDLDTRRTAVAAESLPDALTPARLTSFTVERGGYRVRASSDGTAVLLLPIEFSRCLAISDARGGTSARLFRADLMLTGVLFKDRLDAKISFAYGPFRNRNCRLADLADARAMAVRDAFRDRPEFGRLGVER